MEQQGKSLYLQIYEDIKQRINSGIFQPDQQIPSERELCDIYNVSRITVRQAIYEAIKGDLLYRIQGKGTFVSNGKQSHDPKIVQPLMRMTTFSDTLRMKGLQGKTQVISSKVLPGSFEINSILGLPIDDETILIKLLGCANEDPYTLYYSYFPLKLGEEMLELAKNKEKKGEPFSSYELYKELRKVIPNMVDQTFEATSADQEQASLLKTSVGSPLFSISSVVYNNHEQPLEYKKAFYKGEKYKFRIIRQAPHIQESFSEKAI